MTKFELEYPVKSSVKVLYDSLVDSSKLTEWFCDDITLYDNGKKMEFFWEGSGQIEITNDVALIVIDFAEEDELEEAKMLWDNQIRDLFISLGA